jgi:predicted ATPase/class 3 adenylate cyclase
MIKCPGCGEENPPKFRLCGYCGVPLAQAPAPPPLPVREVRKTVTLIFSDLKDSTALGETLDPEALHEVKDRYFTAMAAEITRHGGKIEKYIGDAIMAVFGLPRAHEDDALRAVRAAVGMQQALERVNADLRARYGVALGNRTGVNTGEVVANDDPTADQKLATGNAVNVCARLEQAAPVNQIYLGELTWRLVRDAVEVEPVEPLELKGKSQKVPAYRLVSALGLDGLVRRHDQPIVGREGELATLRAAFDDVARSGVVRTVTLFAQAGVGKTRLVQEVLEKVAPHARVLSGRCLPYGDGITFWPLYLMVREAAGIDEDDSPQEALRKVDAAAGDHEIALRLVSAAGYGSYPLAEVNWAARKFLEHFGSAGPVVAFIDDIHWAEPAFLDLLEHVQDSAHGPILVLTTSRPDLLEDRPAWGTQPGSTRLELKPLDAVQSAALVRTLLGGVGLGEDIVQRIVTASEGNPLYAEQMLSMLIDGGALHRDGDQWVRFDPQADVIVPPTIQALLEARLDKLSRAERAVVEPASVVGLEFPQPAVESLAPDAVRQQVVEHLGTLTRKQFVHPQQTADADIVYRFHHHLVRETVYNGLLKRARANLHLAFVRWADQVHASHDRRREYEEILGYHLEQAFRYLKELGPLDDAGRAVGADAARRLSASGRRAAARGDMAAAANLYTRSVAVLEPGDPNRSSLLPELAEAQMGIGDFAAAKASLDAASVAAEAANDLRLIARARLIGLRARMLSGETEDWSAQTQRTCDELLPALERDGAHRELAMGWRLIAFSNAMGGQYSRASEALAQSMAHARQAGDQHLIVLNAELTAQLAPLGPMPVAEGIATCERLLGDLLRDRVTECYVTCALAQLKAMEGKVDIARELVRDSRRALRDLGQGVHAASTALDLARIELLRHDLAAAQAELQADYDYLSARGETYYLSTLAAMLAKVARERGHDDEALVLTRTAESLSAEDDVDSQVLWRMVRAPILARRGDAATAEALAREAVELSTRTEATVMQAEAYGELATVLALGGRPADARAAADEALARFEAKGHRVGAARSRDWAAALPTP